jgi:hypothetical protein
VYFGDFMYWDEPINDTKLEQTEYNFNTFVLFFQLSHVIKVREYNDNNVNEGSK